MCGVCCCSTELVDRVPSDMEGLAESFERLQHSLQHAQEYVDDVVVGWVPVQSACCGVLAVLYTAWARGCVDLLLF